MDQAPNLVQAGYVRLAAPGGRERPAREHRQGFRVRISDVDVRPSTSPWRPAGDPGIVCHDGEQQREGAMRG